MLYLTNNKLITPKLDTFFFSRILSYKVSLFLDIITHLTPNLTLKRKARKGNCMKQNKKLITYALGASLLICCYSIVTNLTQHQTGVCYAGAAEGQNDLVRTVEIVRRGEMAQNEIFLSSLVSKISQFDDGYEVYFENLRQLDTLERINTKELAAKINAALEHHKIAMEQDRLEYRLIEMKIFEAFRLFLSMDPATSPYKWETIRLQLCAALEGMQNLSGEFVNPKYQALLKDLQSLHATSWNVTIALRLKPYTTLLPQSIQKQCGPGLARYIKK